MCVVCMYVWSMYTCAHRESSSLHWVSSFITPLFNFETGSLTEPGAQGLSEAAREYKRSLSPAAGTGATDVYCHPWLSVCVPGLNSDPNTRLAGTSAEPSSQHTGSFFMAIFILCDLETI